MTTKSSRFRQAFFWIIRFIGLILIGYSIYALISRSSSTNGRYITIILQALCLIVLSFIPAFINRVWKLSLPIGIEIFFLGYCSCGLLLGEIAGFFTKVWWWDSVLHTISGSFIACIGFIIISIFNEKDGVPMRISPGFLILFVFCLSLSCGLIWEVFEWIFDAITGSNMQRYSDNVSREGFIGRAALRDTMKDLILDTVGAGIICVLSYIDMRTDTNYFNKYFRIKRISENKNLDIELNGIEKDNTNIELDSTEK